ncbi:hypothetical protein [Bordetella genomosp. 11]|uniref:hypothetical protein n=1 Tax=Bordetella genomosp. 11 TaxID=1416808 RepID=UPI00113FD9A3|nr:hypothetical protein [Bordetella genomosp. 11]
MPNITSSPPNSLLYTDSTFASAHVPRSQARSSVHRDARDTGTTPANKKVLDMVTLLDAAAREPEKLLDSGPTYYSIRPSREETFAWTPA